MKRFLAMTLALCLALAMLAGCNSNGSKQPDSTQPAGNSPAAPTSPATPDSTEPAPEGVTGISDETLVIGTDNNPSALCSQYAISAFNTAVTHAIYDNLFKWNDETKTAEPCLATGYEWIDSTHLRVFLREGVYFSNGEEFNADDVIFTWEQGFNGSANAAYRLMGDPANFIVEDDYTIQFVFPNPYGCFTEAVCTAYFQILNRDYFEEIGGDLQVYAQKPIGTGMYTLEEWVDGEYIVLNRNDDYWDQDALPYYKTLRYNIISDNAARALALESGDIDVGLMLDITVAPELEDAGLAANVYSMNWGKCLLFGYENNEALQDIRVREAIHLAINVDAMLNITNTGYGLTQWGLLAGSSSLYFVPSNAPAVRTTNVERAIELMKESGYYNNLTLKCIMNTATPEDPQAMQTMLAEIGIDVQLEQFDNATFLSEKNKGNYDLIINSIDNSDLIKILNQIDSRCTPAQATGGSRYNGENEAELHAILDACKAAMTDEEKAQTYQALADFVYDNHVLVGIASQVRLDAHSGELTGLSYDVRSWPVLVGLRPVA